MFLTTGLTAGVMLLFLLLGIAIGYEETGWPGAVARILHPNLPLALFLYLPWTFLQQTLFQFYLLGRLRLLCPTHRPFVPSTLCGLIFGAIHVPDLGMAALTALGGTAWSALYLRYRRLWPRAVSPTLVGTTLVLLGVRHRSGAPMECLLRRSVEWPVGREHATRLHFLNKS